MDRRNFLALAAGSVPLWLGHRRVSAASGSKDLTSLTLHEAAQLVRDRVVSPVALTQACLERIDRLNGQLNAFLLVTAQSALAEARAAEKEIQVGRWRGPLHGIPLALKDQIDTQGVLGRPVSRKAPTEDAEVVRRLKHAGAVLLGKLNMGVGVEGWGAAHNPWALDRECAYSSSGAGSAVAADLCFAALGTDGAGSVRLPAAACGVVGFKPTYGLVSNRGAGDSPMGHVGPLGKTVLDCALLLETIAGHDPGWKDSIYVPASDYAAALRAKSPGFRVGRAQGGFFDDLDPEVGRLTDAALETIGTLAELSDAGPSVPLYWEIYEGLDADPRSAAYEKAERAQQAARAAAPSIFGDRFDLLVLPAWKRLPMTIEERRRTWPLPKIELRRELWNTVPFNVLGLPAISIPCGFTRAGLPVGLQIVGPALSDRRVLALAHMYEQVTTWHSRTPPIASPAQ